MVERLGSHPFVIATAAEKDKMASFHRSDQSRDRMGENCLPLTVHDTFLYLDDAFQ